MCAVRNVFYISYASLEQKQRLNREQSSARVGSACAEGFDRKDACAVLCGTPLGPRNQVRETTGLDTRKPAEHSEGATAAAEGTSSTGRARDDGGTNDAPVTLHGAPSSSTIRPFCDQQRTRGASARIVGISFLRQPHGCLDPHAAVEAAVV